MAVAVGRSPLAGREVGRDGVWLARLETAVTADDVVDALIAALNVPGGEASLLETLRTAAAVVILDNCEHVVEAAAVLVARLLDAAPQLRILATSQVPLGIEDEAVFAPLPSRSTIQSSCSGTEPPPAV